MAYVPEPFPVAGVVPGISDLMALYDANGLDVTASCGNKIHHAGDRFVLLLNDFEPPGVYYTPRVFAGQNLPGSGVKRVVFKQPGYILRAQPTPFYFSLFPLQALQDIYRRNLERVQQRAYLEYLFDQTQDPGRILWQPGEHKLSGKAVWWVDKTREDSSSTFTRPFKVIKPFEAQTVTAGGEQVEVQSFTPYLRRMIPLDGARPVYRHLYPAGAYRCNYINDMLQKGERRLLMLLFDSSNNPLRYSQVKLQFTTFDRTLATEFRDLSRNLTAVSCRDLQALKSTIPQITPGLDYDRIANAYGPGLSERLEKQLAVSEDGKGTVRIYSAGRDALLGEARRVRHERLVQPDRQAGRRAARLQKRLAAALRNADDRALLLQLGDEVILVSLQVVQSIVEYRYTNDDLKLDVSSLNVSACLKPGQPQQLNAYERGYFAATLPHDVTWDGPQPNTRYAARIYCLDVDQSIGNQVPDQPVLHSFSFTTSQFITPEDLQAMFASDTSLKVRDVRISKALYDQSMKLASSMQLPASFDHPDKSGVKLHLGLDLFRQLADAPALNITTSARDLAEAYYKRCENGQVQIVKARKAEGQALDDLFKILQRSPDPISARRLTATWLRTEEGASQADGTLGLLLDFPEPLDWERSGLHIARFKVRLNESSQEINLLQLPARYQVAFYWLRSLDGARLALVPRLTETRIQYPEDIWAGDRLETLHRWSERADPHSMTAVGRSEAMSPESLPAESASPGPVAIIPKDETTGVVFSARPAFLGDYARSSITGLADLTEAARLAHKFGQQALVDISRYQVTDLEMVFYYLSDNYEQHNANFRPIPRLRFHLGDPGDAHGQIGSLKPLAKK